VLEIGHCGDEVLVKALADSRSMSGFPAMCSMKSDEQTEAGGDFSASSASK
jgi:hypothetical protein